MARSHATLRPVCQLCCRPLTNPASRTRTVTSAAAAAAGPSTGGPGQGRTTANPSELEHFTRLASEWWKPNSEYRVLSRMNEPRVELLRERLARNEPALWGRTSFLAGKQVLDVGSGGGIFSETLARLGGSVLGIDAGAANVDAARAHAALDPGFSSSSPAEGSSQAPQKWTLSYRHTTAEQLLQEQREAFDLVVSMEVLEHVDQPRDFLASLAGLTKPGGTILLSTISRTALAYLLTIAIAEYSPLRFAAPGTHTYSKYVRPQEISGFFEELGWGRGEARGVMYLPWRGKWVLGEREQQPEASWLNAKDRQANYFFAVQKPL